MYVVSIVAYQDYQDRCRPSQKKKLDFHTRGTEVRMRTILCKRLKFTDGFFLAVKKTILCCSFLTLVANT